MRHLAIAALAGNALTAPVFADGSMMEACGSLDARVAILSNDFPALHLIIDRAQDCMPQATVNATSEHKNIQVPALTADPAEYTVTAVANGSLVPLLSDGLIRPLDDLIEKYAEFVQPDQLISVNGQAYALAFMVNAQHLFYREDVLAAAGVAPPTTWD